MGLPQTALGFRPPLMPRRRSSRSSTADSSGPVREPDAAGPGRPTPGSEVSPTCNVPSSRPQVKRTCQVWSAGGGRWVLTLTCWHLRRSAVDQHYHLAAIPSDWGRAFDARKLQAGGGEVYHVHLTSDGPACGCKGFLRWAHCKHTESLAALDGRGKLPAPQAEGGAA